MKNLFKNLMLVAVAAMGFTACEQVGVESVAPVAPEVKMTVIAGMDETRTYIDEANSIVKWSEGDKLEVIEKSATGISYATTSSIAIENDKALFGVSFDENTADTEFTYNAFYPSSAVVKDDADKRDVTKVKVVVKEQQNATATSFDPAADVLVAKQLEFGAQPTELNMQFKRLVSLGKLTLKNLPADAKIEKVIFTAAEGVKLAGRNYVNATTGEVSQYGYYGDTNALTINYSEAISTRDIYFTCNPFEMEAGETFTVKAVCGDKSYTREVEIPADRSLKFTEGNLGTFSVDMASATVENISAFAEGQYAVIAKSGSKYYAMAGVKGSGNYMTYAEVNYDGTATTFTTEDDTLVWNIKAVDGGYTIQNHEGKYLSGHTSTSSNNYAYLGDAQTLAITPIDGTNQYEVTIKDVSARILSYNSSSPRFAFYATKSQVCQLFLVSVAEDTTPRFTVDIDEYTFEAEGGEIEVAVEKLYGFSGEVMAGTDAEWLDVYGDGETFTIEAGENEDAAREADVTFTSGDLSVTVKISQKAGVVVDSNITVAQFLDLKDTETEYQLTGKITSVANTSYGNFNLTDATGTVYVYGLLTPEGTAQKQWAAAGLKVGDIITIKGKYNVYNNSPQMKNATYISHKAINVDKDMLQFTAEGGSIDVTVTLVNTSDAITATVDNSNFSVALKSGTTYTVTAKTATEAINANLKITAGDLETIIPIAQSAPTTGNATTITLDCTKQPFTTNLPTAKGTYAEAKYTDKAGYEWTLCGTSATGYYFNSAGYLMIGKSGSYIGMPVVDGQKLTSVTLYCNSGASTNVKYQITDTEGTVVTGGTAKNGVSNKTTALTWNLSGTEVSTQYLIKITTAYNGQITKIVLNYE